MTYKCVSLILDPSADEPTDVCTIVAKVHSQTVPYMQSRLYIKDCAISQQ